MAHKYSAHLAQVDDRPGLIITAAIFCVMTISALALRFYARRVTGAGLGADDWLALTALVTSSPPAQSVLVTKNYVDFIHRFLYSLWMESSWVAPYKAPSLVTLLSRTIGLSPLHWNI